MKTKANCRPALADFVLQRPRHVLVLQDHRQWYNLLKE